MSHLAEFMSRPRTETLPERSLEGCNSSERLKNQVFLGNDFILYGNN